MLLQLEKYKHIIHTILKKALRNNSWNHDKEEFEYFINLYGKDREKWVCDIYSVKLVIIEPTEIISFAEVCICNVRTQLKIKAALFREVFRKQLKAEKS